jgi:hypothetical protein
MSFVDQVLKNSYYEKIQIEELRRTICKHQINIFDCVQCNHGGFRKQKMQELRREQLKKENKYCSHAKTFLTCKECVHTLICKHYEYYVKCHMCHGLDMCEHQSANRHCKECHKPTHRLCEHGKDKYYCIYCDGRSLCKTPGCEIIPSNKKYDGYCLRCYVHLFPDKPNACNYKTKERTVVEKIKEKYPNFDWVADKRVQDGCSRRRPDLLLDMGSHVIIIEVDENKHSTYDCACEHRRLMELSQDLQHRPIIFIRFNPDAYTDINGNRIESCWKINYLGICLIKDANAWKVRINKLLDEIQYWIDNSTEKTIEIVELFY